MRIRILIPIPNTVGNSFKSLIVESGNYVLLEKKVKRIVY
jgi:hypothetical protein